MDDWSLIILCALDALDCWIGGLKISCDLLTSCTQKSGAAWYLRVEVETSNCMDGEWITPPPLAIRSTSGEMVKTPDSPTHKE
jgi:hypothetical protein